MIEDEMLELVRSYKDGILQSTVRKTLKIDSKKCSRTVTKLMKKHLIRREPELADGRNTYRIYSTVFSGPSDKHKYFLAGGMFSPCTGCSMECFPESCYRLDEWIQAIIEEES
jgi:Lrp/AsnC family leucine-responsive transcriptional regulator